MNDKLFREFYYGNVIISKDGTIGVIMDYTATGFIIQPVGIQLDDGQIHLTFN